MISPSTAPDLAIVGVGVRTVSFLSFKVYSAAAYVNDYTLKRLRTVPGWTSYDPAQMATEGEKLVQSVLDVPTAMAIRIGEYRGTRWGVVLTTAVCGSSRPSRHSSPPMMSYSHAVPVRNTDFNHLRDGFTRTLLQRLKEARVEGKVTEKDEIGINEGLQRLKAAFPLGSVPKGKELLVVRSPDSVLYLEYEGNIVGTVPNKWIADNMILAYFSKTPISPPVSAVVNVTDAKLRDSAAEGFNQYYKMAWYAPK